MTTTLPKNAAPRAVFEGLEDESARQPAPQPFRRPVHLPLTFLRSSWGPENDQFVSGDEIKVLYGDDVFDRRSKHFTHTNLTAEVSNAAGNALLAVRIVPEDAAAPAGVTVWFDYVPDQVPNYLRNPDQSYKLDVAGQPMPDPNQPTVPGIIYRVYTTGLGEDTAGNVGLGLHKKKAGELISSTDVTSEAFPIFEQQRPHRGARGNWGGFRLQALTTTERNGVRSDLVSGTESMIYRFTSVERPAANKSPLTKTTLSGAQSIEFSFKPGAYDDRMRRTVDIRKTLKQSYNAKNTSGGPDTYGVFSDFHIYEDNLVAVQTAVFDVEKTFGTLGFSGSEASIDMVNWLTAVSPEGVPYFAVKRQGGSLFTSSTTHYAQGGTDGTVNDETFNEGVMRFVDEFQTSPMKMWDWYRVPFSAFHDTGFPLPVKLKLCRLLALRDDIWVAMQTHEYGQPPLSEDDEYSVGMTISQEMLSYPESVISGTGCCRGFIFGNGGVRPALNVEDTVVPMIGFHFLQQISNFAGAANGTLDMNWRPDLPKRNVVRGFVDTNAQSKNDRMIDNFWESGIVYAQFKDRADIFVPAYQTVYEDDTSIFNSALTMILMVEVIKVCRESWTELTGINGLTEEQFILRSNNEIRKRINTRFGDLLQVEPDTYFSPTSSQLGYPWNCRVRCSGSVMRTVGLFEVVGARLEN